MEVIVRKRIQRVEVVRKLQKITRRYGIWNLYNKKKAFLKTKNWKILFTIKQARDDIINDKEKNISSIAKIIFVLIVTQLSQLISLTKA